jgi:DNA-binding transcriptional LysR family regulator
MKQIQTTLPTLISAVQAADSGSFTAAANVLGLTPAAVSKNVATLEAFLKVRLFNRTTRRLSLTEEGKVFISQTRDGLISLEEAAVQATQGLSAQGTVRLNCPVGFGRRFVLPLLPAFYELYPQVRVDLNLNDQSVDLVGEGFDIGIRGGSQPPEGMVARKIFDITTILVASPKYLKRKGTPKHYTELAEHDLLQVKFHSGRMLPWLFMEKGKNENQIQAFEGRGKLVISDPEIVLDAALLHMGIAALGAYDTYHAIKRGDLVEVLAHQRAPSGISMSLFYPHRAGLAPRVKVLVDYLRDQLSKDVALQSPRPVKTLLE